MLMIYFLFYMINKYQKLILTRQLTLGQRNYVRTCCACEVMHVHVSKVYWRVLYTGKG